MLEVSGRLVEVGDAIELRRRGTPQRVLSVQPQLVSGRAQPPLPRHGLGHEGLPLSQGG
jgi:hypothetical protein